MIEQQQKLILSPYMEIYPPIRIFKYLLLKAIYDLSNVDVIDDFSSCFADNKK